MEQLTIRTHAHACFEVTYRGFTVVFDPYQDHYLPGLPPIDAAADLVLCSHGHGDHSAAEVIRPLTGHENPWKVIDIPTFHDECGGAKRGTNLIRVLESPAFRIAHFGDIGHPLSPEQLAAIGPLDAAMIPVGGFFTIGPEQAWEMAQAVKPKVLIPMHYKMGSAGLQMVAPLDDFLALAQGNIVRYDAILTLTENPERQIAVLDFPL